MEEEEDEEEEVEEVEEEKVEKHWGKGRQPPESEGKHSFVRLPP